jgi:Fic family protein
MARCLQTLTLAREQIVTPVFSSIEEYLGRNTQAYYDILGEVGRGSWDPQNDARPWIHFCLTAHYHQARTQVRRIQETEQLYVACSALTTKHRLPERTAGALAEAALGFRLRNTSYRSVIDVTYGEELSDLTASRDLRAIVEAGLLEPIGNSRGRYYTAKPVLREEFRRIREHRAPREVDDPFQIALGRLERDGE